MVQLVCGLEQRKKIEAVPLSNDVIHSRIADMSSKILKRQTPVMSGDEPVYTWAMAPVCYQFVPEAEDVFDYADIEVPTVLGLLKKILSQYPDNGQIIKELVQNAEDAGASKVDVVHDTRSLEFPEAHQDVQSFVRGPALCLYNDAVFSEEDWYGIRKLSDSIKKDDPLRVGQFGLGFKSVFHITDYVTIISGSKLLFMDPSERVLFMDHSKPPVNRMSLCIL
ncbi:hypothetical protein Pmani_024835 [Petrolisthes manimaculis]|uniref:Sacsin/Nov domain-containing protein n=1 Tax=Petrolisthes manimaculis TaxID=1843537 RepID=A0AAE1U1W9_9EUCA|nr:hypothetical protein Pmani_024835 [Petrolisthes manimaculis]